MGIHNQPGAAMNPFGMSHMNPMAHANPMNPMAHANPLNPMINVNPMANPNQTMQAKKPTLLKKVKAWLANDRHPLFHYPRIEMTDNLPPPTNGIGRIDDFGYTL